MAFVYNNRILAEYNGVKEGQQLYREKEKTLTATLDTLENEINSLLKNYQNESRQLSDKENMLTESMIKRRQADYFNYKKAIEDKIKEEDTKLTAAVMHQIDSYIAEFGKKNGYTYILGASNEGSLFFANDKEDITDIILEGLNNTYAGK